MIFQSTCSVWSKTIISEETFNQVKISIHLLRVEQDISGFNPKVKYIYFNPLAPCGARPARPTTAFTAATFQSTCSVWSKTWPRTAHKARWRYFNPLAPCGARHGLRRCTRMRGRFQSTCSVWSKTQPPVNFVPFHLCISIHLLRVEQDTRRA